MGGQPGAGKSELERLARKELGQNVINCNADIFRDYHPDAEKIKAKHESYYPEITAEYAQAWNKGLREYCEANRMNYILETTFSSGSQMNKTIAELQEKGYRVDLKVLAVHPKLSLLGTHLRYEHMRLKENSGRLVGKDPHDSRYNMIAPTLYLVQAEGLYSKLQIYGRSLQDETSLSTAGVNLLATNPENAVQVFQQEVDRKWTADQRLYFLQGVDKIIVLKQGRGAPEHEINAFKTEMASKYPSQREMQVELEAIIHEQTQEDLLAKRLAGILPNINIDGTNFTIDLHLKEIRETANPANSIPFKNMQPSESGESYLCYYNTKKNCIVYPANDITVLPKNVMVLEIPNEIKLDPIGFARKNGLTPDAVMKEHPLQKTITATLHPLSYSELPELVKSNLAEQERQESLKNDRNQSRGMRM